MAVRVPMWSKIADPGLVEAAPSAFGFKNAGTIFSNMGLSIIIHLKFEGVFNYVFNLFSCIGLY